MSLATVTMMLAAGCSDVELVGNQEAQHREFKLEVSVGTESRTMMKDGMNIWNSGDAVYVFSEDESVYGVLRLVEGSIKNNGKTAKFSGTVNGNADLKNVVYPANNYVGRNVPAPEDFKISMTDIEGENHNAPMQASIGNGGATFEYVGGLVRFQITGAEDKEAVFDAKSGQVSLTGGYYEWGQDGLEFVPTSTTTTTIHNIPEGGVVYLPVAVTTEAEEGTATPEATIIAWVQKSPSEKIADISTEDAPLEVPVSKGDISTEKVPNYVVGSEGEVEVSTFVYNEAGEGKMTLAEALEDGDANIKLAEDITLTETLAIEERLSVTLDLNGKKLAVARTSDLLGKGNVGVLNEGQLFLEGDGEKSEIIDNSETGWATVANYEGKLTIKGVKISSKHNHAVLSRSDDFNTIPSPDCNVVPNTELVIENSTINSTYSGNDESMYAVRLDAYQHAVVKNSKINSLSGALSAASADLTLDGGSVSATEKWYGLHMWCANVKIVNDPKISSFDGKSTVKVQIKGETNLSNKENW